MKAHGHAHTLHADAPHLGFQIAPMIDVVFVIMLFFMVMAGAIKAEHELSTVLPSSGLMDIPADEIIIGISEDGFITLNDDEVAPGNDTKLEGLGDRLASIKLEATFRGVPPIVVVKAEESARYQRIVDVINVMERVGLKSATFTVGELE